MKFVGPSYHLNTRRADVQQTVNMFTVKTEAPGGKSVAYLDSIPGLRQFSTSLGDGGFLLLESGGFLLLESGGLIELESA